MRRVLADYSEDAGHDSAWVGMTRFVLLRDRLDRAFSSGRYQLTPGADLSTGLDLVHAELPPEDIATLPLISSGAVRRVNMNNSPGWQHGKIRWLIASAPHGGLDRIPWPQKSATKQSVARQPNPDPEPSLFDDYDGEENGPTTGETLDADTFVVAHTLDAISGHRELILGRPRLNDGGGNPWHWRENLLDAPPRGTRATRDPAPPLPPDDVPDVEVRLRSAEERRRLQ